MVAMIAAKGALQKHIVGLKGTRAIGKDGSIA